jgi:putative nucleotidyltransferase with HDIG domain
MRGTRAFQFLSKLLRQRKLIRRGLSVGIKRRTGETTGFRNYFQSAALPRVLTGVVFLVLAVQIIWAGGYYYWPRLTVGQRAMEDVYSSIDFTFRDYVQTEMLRQDAVQKVPAIYKLDESRVSADLAKLSTLLKSAPASRDGSSGDTDLFDSVSRLLDSRDPDEIKTLLESPDAAGLMAKLTPIILKICQYRIAPVPVPFPAEQTGVQVRSASEVMSELRNAIQEQFPQPENNTIRRVLEAVSSDFTSIFSSQYRREDAEAARKLQTFARKSVSLQFTSVPPGTKIVERGEEITAGHVAQIEEMRKALAQRRSPMARLINLVGTALAIAALVVGCAAFLAQFHQLVFRRNSRLILVACLVLASMGISKLFVYLRPASVFFAYPIAVPFGSFILSMMLGLRLAAFVTIPMAVLLGISFGSSLSPVLIGILGGWAAAFSATGVRHRKDFIKAGAIVGLVNGVAIAGIGALASAKLAMLMVQAAGGVAVAMGSILLAAVVLPVFEWLFKIPTSVSLVELTDSNHPLLKKMIMETPGTYYHSLMVGNLAESAAEAVNANPLLARVGSYFHDIGKLRKPRYFSENEALGRSKHDTLNPSMSNLIILSHVKDGVDIACKYKLNKSLIDIIRQHHGTSLDYYFYHRAGEISGGDSPVDEKEFRYPGPRPQSRESAIIMLADSVEAASRSLERPTTAKIRTAVRNIIRMKFEDGQLDECDVTLKDLHQIEETFTRILLNTLHQRVKYPEEKKETKDESDERPVPEHAERSGHSGR